MRSNRKLLILVLLSVALLGVAFAQATVDALDPQTWFASPASILLIGSVLAGWAVKLSTALGKDWFQTSGQSTVILSAVLAVVIAGVGGYLAMGTFAGAGGLKAAISAAVMIALSFLGANGSAKAERQAQSSALARAKISTKLQ